MYYLLYKQCLSNFYSTKKKFLIICHIPHCLYMYMYYKLNHDFHTCTLIVQNCIYWKNKIAKFHQYEYII